MEAGMEAGMAEGMEAGMGAIMGVDPPLSSEICVYVSTKFSSTCRWADVVSLGVVSVSVYHCTGVCVVLVGVVSE